MHCVLSPWISRELKVFRGGRSLSLRPLRRLAGLSLYCKWRRTWLTLFPRNPGEHTGRRNFSEKPAKQLAKKKKGSSSHFFSGRCQSSNSSPFPDVCSVAAESLLTSENVRTLSPRLLQTAPVTVPVPPLNHPVASLLYPRSTRLGFSGFLATRCRPDSPLQGSCFRPH